MADENDEFLKDDKYRNIIRSLLLLADRLTKALDKVKFEKNQEKSEVKILKRQMNSKERC